MNLNNRHFLRLPAGHDSDTGEIWEERPTKHRRETIT